MHMLRRLVSMKKDEELAEMQAHLTSVVDEYCEECWENGRFISDKHCFAGKPNMCCICCYEKCDLRCEFSRKILENKKLEILKRGRIKLEIELPTYIWNKIERIAEEEAKDGILASKILLEKILRRAVVEKIVMLGRDEF